MEHAKALLGEVPKTLKRLPGSLAVSVKRILSPKFIKAQKLVILVLILLCAYPIVPNALGMDYIIQIGILANIYAMIALAWDINGGYTGQGNLAPAFFAGICGYTSAILTTQAGFSPWVSLPIGVFLSFLAAVGIGFPSLRMKGPYLVIVTFSVSEVARKLTIYYSAITKGEEGIGAIPKLFTGTAVNFYWTLFVLILLLLFARTIMKSRLGLAFRAIAEDETRAKTLGINVTKYKIVSFSICGIIAGVGGGIYVHYQSNIDPSFFSIIMAISVISMAVIGGEKTLYGAVLGAYLLQFSSEGLRFVTGGAPWVRLSINGLLLVVVMLFLPGGLLGLVRKLRGGGKKKVVTNAGATNVEEEARAAE